VRITAGSAEKPNGRGAFLSNQHSNVRADGGKGEAIKPVTVPKKVKVKEE